MGEAKLKQKSHANILALNPGCIYCAGANAATTIEHMPQSKFSKGDNGRRVPACKRCNNGTGHSDLVASMLPRVMPHADSTVLRKDLTKIISAVSNNVPGLLHEMHIGRGAEKLARRRLGLPDDMHPLRADGPILSGYMLTFAAKLGFALHYEVNGTPLPTRGGETR